MLVNSQKSGHLGLSLTTNPKKHHFASTTPKLGLTKCFISISYVCRHPSGPRHPAPAPQDMATKSGNQQLRHVTCIYKTKVSEHNSMSYRGDATVRSLRFPARSRTLLQGSLQTVRTGRRKPGLLSTTRNRSQRQS